MVVAVEENERQYGGIKEMNFRVEVVENLLGSQYRSASFGGNMGATGARQVGIEVGAVAEGATRRRRDRARPTWGTEREADDVVEAVRIVVGSELDAVVCELLVDAGAPGLAGFGLQGRIPRVAGIGPVRLIEARLFDALAVENAVKGIAPEPASVAQDEGGSYARDDARAETRVGFGAPAEIERSARMRKKTEVQVAALVVAADVRLLKKGE